MELLTLQQISERLKGKNLAQIQRDTGFSRPTLYSLRDQTSDNFLYSTVVVMSDYLKAGHDH